MKNKRLIKLKIEKERLLKEKQILYSWNWFYLNSSNNLYATRYKKVETTDNNNNKVMDDVYVRDKWHHGYGQAISSSVRFREDRRSSIGLNLPIKKNIEAISKNHKEISDEYDKLNK